MLSKESGRGRNVPVRLLSQSRFFYDNMLLHKIYARTYTHSHFCSLTSPALTQSAFAILLPTCYFTSVLRCKPTLSVHGNNNVFYSELGLPDYSPSLAATKENRRSVPSVNIFALVLERFRKFRSTVAPRAKTQLCRIIQGPHFVENRKKKKR